MKPVAVLSLFDWRVPSNPAADSSRVSCPFIALAAWWWEHLTQQRVTAKYSRFNAVEGQFSWINRKPIGRFTFENWCL